MSGSKEERTISNSSAPPSIYVISDSIGETAELVARAAAAQYNSGHFEIRRFPLVDDAGALREVVAQAAADNSIIVYTIVLPELGQALKQEAERRRVPAVDIMGPVLQAIEQVTELRPKHQAGVVHRLDDEYFRRIEAVEFAVKYDDGKDPRGVFAPMSCLLASPAPPRLPSACTWPSGGLRWPTSPWCRRFPSRRSWSRFPPARSSGSR